MTLTSRHPFLTVMKPLHAKWIIDLYNELTSEKGKEIVLSGWRASGTLDAVEMGTAKLPTLDPRTPSTECCCLAINCRNFSRGWVTLTLIPGVSTVKANLSTA